MAKHIPISARCQQCGELRTEHWLVNYADGPHVGKAALLCPTAIYRGLDKDED